MKIIAKYAVLFAVLYLAGNVAQVESGLIRGVLDEVGKGIHKIKHVIHEHFHPNHVHTKDCGYKGGATSTTPIPLDKVDDDNSYDGRQAVTRPTFNTLRPPTVRPTAFVSAIHMSEEDPIDIDIRSGGDDDTVGKSQTRTVMQVQCRSGYMRDGSGKCRRAS